ncbi:MAG: anti-sigma factor antagonist [Gammaproteobacteria bacterium]|nr:anti-sigma factor antagonist [Gammaproteobacteria bacterium]
MNQPASGFKATQESVNGVVVVAPEGRLDFGSAAEFQRQLEATIGGSDKPRGVVIDCTGLSYVSSAGLRSFLVGARAAKSAGTTLVACSLTTSVREVFAISGFSRLIEEYPNRQAALAKIG